MGFKQIFTIGGKIGIKYFFLGKIMWVQSVANTVIRKNTLRFSNAHEFRQNYNFRKNWLRKLYHISSSSGSYKSRGCQEEVDNNAADECLKTSGGWTYQNSR